MLDYIAIDQTDPVNRIKKEFWAKHGEKIKWLWENTTPDTTPDWYLENILGVKGENGGSEGGGNDLFIQPCE